MSRRMEYLVAASASCCGILRCDQPYPTGLGTSMLCTRAETQLVPTDRAIAWPLLLPLHPQQHPASVLVSPPPRRVRTERYDNCGSRVVRRGVLLPHIVVEPASAPLLRPSLPSSSASISSSWRIRFAGADSNLLVVQCADATAAGDGGSEHVIDIRRRLVLPSSKRSTELPLSSAPTTTAAGDDGGDDDAQLRAMLVASCPPELLEGNGCIICVDTSTTKTAASALAAAAAPGHHKESQPEREHFCLAVSPARRVATLCQYQAYLPGMANSIDRALTIWPRHSFAAGPLGFAALAYDQQSGRLATVSAQPIYGLGRGKSSRYVVTVWSVAQNRLEFSLPALLLGA